MRLRPRRAVYAGLVIHYLKSGRKRRGQKRGSHQPRTVHENVITHKNDRGLLLSTLFIHPIPAVFVIDLYSKQL